MILKLSLLLGALPLAALVLRPESPPTTPAALAPADTEEERACQQEGNRFGSETVRVRWTHIGVVAEDVDVFYCVLRGDARSPVAFLRNAERVRFTMVGRGNVARQGTFAFAVRTTRGDTIELGPALVHIEPDGRRSCRVEICQAFTDPGDLVLNATVHTY